MPEAVPEPVRAAVVGAGLGGALAALYLDRAGYRVEVYEGHGDPRAGAFAGPSMNLGLSRRGIEALRRVGLDRRVLERAIAMRGRAVHHADGTVVEQPYGRADGQVIHAVQRREINCLLLDALDEQRVPLHFGRRLTGLDRDRGELRFDDGSGGGAETVRPDFTVGADGLHSTVRAAIQRGLPAELERRALDWGWKELTVPAAAGAGLAADAFHLWPRGGSMVFAHPNRDGTFTCSLVLPLEGRRSFAELSEDGRVEALFAAEYPDLAAAIPDLGEQFRGNPVISLVSIRTSPWSWRDRFVLLGDAAHAVVPFLAQGMNAAFEDCGLLVEALARLPGSRAAAFADFEGRRKPDTDALEAMSRANFHELRDRVRSPWLRLHRAATEAVGARLPNWMPLHARITNTTVPYAEAARIARRQDRLLAGVALAAAAGVGLAVWNLLHRRKP